MGPGRKQIGALMELAVDGGGLVSADATEKKAGDEVTRRREKEVIDAKKGHALAISKDQE